MDIEDIDMSEMGGRMNPIYAAAIKKAWIAYKSKVEKKKAEKKTWQEFMKMFSEKDSTKKIKRAPSEWTKFLKKNKKKEGETFSDYMKRMAKLYDKKKPEGNTDVKKKKNKKVATTTKKKPTKGKKTTTKKKKKSPVSEKMVVRTKEEMKGGEYIPIYGGSNMSLWGSMLAYLLRKRDLKTTPAMRSKLWANVNEQYKSIWSSLDIARQKLNQKGQESTLQYIKRLYEYVYGDTRGDEVFELIDKSINDVYDAMHSSGEIVIDVPIEQRKKGKTYQTLESIEEELDDTPITKLDFAIEGLANSLEKVKQLVTSLISYEIVNERTNDLFERTKNSMDKAHLIIKDMIKDISEFESYYEVLAEEMQKAPK